MFRAFVERTGAQSASSIRWHGETAPTCPINTTRGKTSEHVVHSRGMWYVPEWIEKVVEHVLGATPNQLKYIRRIVDFFFRIGSFSNMTRVNISTQGISMP